MYNLRTFNKSYTVYPLESWYCMLDNDSPQIMSDCSQLLCYVYYILYSVYVYE